MTVSNPQPTRATERCFLWWRTGGLVWKRPCSEKVMSSIGQQRIQMLSFQFGLVSTHQQTVHCPSPCSSNGSRSQDWSQTYSNTTCAVTQFSIQLFKLVLETTGVFLCSRDKDISVVFCMPSAILWSNVQTKLVLVSVPKCSMSLFSVILSWKRLRQAVGHLIPRAVLQFKSAWALPVLCPCQWN